MYDTVLYIYHGARAAEGREGSLEGKGVGIGIGIGIEIE